MERPADGIYVHGLYLEGARWDPVAHSLDDSRPKELFTQFPVVREQHTQKSHGDGAGRCRRRAASISSASFLRLTLHSDSLCIALVRMRVRRFQMWLLPEEERVESTVDVYRCPVYKILTRRGTLSTTGHRSAGRELHDRTGLSQARQGMAESRRCDVRWRLAGPLS